MEEELTRILFSRRPIVGWAKQADTEVLKHEKMVAEKRNDARGRHDKRLCRLGRAGEIELLEPLAPLESSEEWFPAQSREDFYY